MQVNLRLLFILVAGAMFVSACVTTTAVMPGELGAIAGLQKDDEATLFTADGPVTVSGSTDITLRWSTKDGHGATELRLSELRIDAGLLILPETGARVALTDVWSADVTKPAPAATVGLVFGIILGTAVLAAATFLIVGAIAWSNAKF